MKDKEAGDLSGHGQEKDLAPFLEQWWYGTPGITDLSLTFPVEEGVELWCLHATAQGINFPGVTCWHSSPCGGARVMWASLEVTTERFSMGSSLCFVMRLLQRALEDTDNYLCKYLPLGIW